MSDKHITLEKFSPGCLAVVVGAGSSGQAAARLLHELGARVRLLEYDEKNIPTDFVAWAAKNGIEIQFGEHSPPQFADAKFLIPSPGAAIASLLPLLADNQDIEIMAETELAWRCLQGEPVIGVTGTSGKTTTTSLIAAMLEAAGQDVFIGGNIGTPLSEYILARRLGRPKADAIVLELSSFQLQTVSRLHPCIGVLLNISENHLDYHKDMEEYLAAKMRLFARQNEADLMIVNRDLQDAIAKFNPKARLTLFDKNARNFPELKLLGPHNQANAEAAWQAVRELGVSRELAGLAAQAFLPIPNRLEIVTEHGGVLYVNDSKATTVEALRVALQSFERPIRLLAGGKFKGGDLAGLAELLQAKVQHLGLYGASRDIFTAAWGHLIPTTWDETMRQAILRQKELALPGDVILLAPATASFDQYANYVARGDDFRCIVREFCPATGGDANE